MAHTLLEAAKLSQNPLTAGVLTAIATTDELLASMSMRGQLGEAYTFDREKALPSSNFVSPNHTSIIESAATFDKVTNSLRLIVDDVDIYNFAEEQQGETNNQRAIQMEKKLKSLGRNIGNKIVTGGYATSVTVSAAVAGTSNFVAGPYQDSTRHGPGSLFYDQSEETMQYRGPGDVAYGAPVSTAANGTVILPSDNPSMKLTLDVVTASLPAGDAEILVRIVSSTEEIDGLARLIPSSQTIVSTGANGDALGFGVLDKMLDELVKIRERQVFVMPGKLKTKFHALLRGLGGAAPETFEMNGRRIPMYRGVPILQSDWIPTTETKASSSTLSSVYLLSLDENEGFSLRVGAQGQEMAADLDPRSTRVMGVKIREVGQLEDKEANRDRLSWYGCTHLGSELSVARASEIETA